MSKPEGDQGFSLDDNAEDLVITGLDEEGLSADGSKENYGSVDDEAFAAAEEAGLSLKDLEEDGSEESNSNNEESEEEEDDSSASNDGGTLDEDTGNANTGEEDDEVDDEVYFSEITEETGISVESDDDIVNALKELKELKSNPYQNLSPAIQEAIKVEQSGGDLANHFKIASMDFEQMDGKEVLKQKFFKDESKLYASNPKLAQMKFEKMYQERYKNYLKSTTIQDEYEKEDYISEVGEDSIELDKMMLEEDVKAAREEMTQWREQSKPQEVRNGMTKEQAQKFALEYQEKAKTALSNFEAVELDMGEGREPYLLGLNEQTRPMVEEWANSPASFLEAIGIEGQNIDIERLLPIMALTAEAAVGTLGGRVAKYVVDNKDIETFESQTTKTTPRGVAVPQNRDADDEWALIGEAAENMRRNNM